MYASQCTEKLRGTSKIHIGRSNEIQGLTKRQICIIIIKIVGQNTGGCTSIRLEKKCWKQACSYMFSHSGRNSTAWGNSSYE